MLAIQKRKTETARTKLAVQKSNRRAAEAELEDLKAKYDMLEQQTKDSKTVCTGICEIPRVEPDKLTHFQREYLGQMLCNMERYKGVSLGLDTKKERRVWKKQAVDAFMSRKFIKNEEK